MPKERIRTNQQKHHHYETQDEKTGKTEAGHHVTTPFEVQVSWGNQHPSVTLATVNTEEDPFTIQSGWHIELTRTEVNRLITTLRRARDKAFGKDA